MRILSIDDFARFQPRAFERPVDERAGIPPLDLEGAHRRFRALLLGEPAKCEGPCERVGVALIRTASQTLYPWDGKGLDPNRARMLCEECSEDYTLGMDEQWRDYYSGLL